MKRVSRREPPEAGSLAFSFVALVLVFTGLGYVLDRWLETGPWLMVAGVFVGAGLGFVYLVFILFAGSPRRGGRKDENRDDEGPEGRSS
jgi:F0F1-type ATP synthase assembly protein I